MINLEYTKTFIKDFKKLKNTIWYQELFDFCFNDIDSIPDWFNTNDIKKIKGYDNYYRIRKGVYRIGIKLENNTITFVRILHRNDVYKFFP
jgi:mRNA-degrading endonuclease RelE of RelBE toxin-antitoxin system